MKTRTLVASVFAAPLAMVLIVGTAYAGNLTRELQFGMTGSDVSDLQTFLAADPSIYPQGLVTGYFGPLTKAAVINFQARNEIPTVGRVGPITLAAINAKMAGGGNSDPLAEGAGKVTNYGSVQPTLGGVSVVTTTNSATLTWSSNISATPKVYYSTTWPFVLQTAPAITGSGPSMTQSVTLTNLQSATNYYYVLESLDAQGNFSWSTTGSPFKTQ